MLGARTASVGTSNAANAIGSPYTSSVLMFSPGRGHIAIIATTEPWGHLPRRAVLQFVQQRENDLLLPGHAVIT